jgi:hypothetical protein
MSKSNALSCLRNLKALPNSNTLVASSARVLRCGTVKALPALKMLRNSRAGWAGGLRVLPPREMHIAHFSKKVEEEPKSPFAFSCWHVRFRDSRITTKAIELLPGRGTPYPTARPFQAQRAFGPHAIRMALLLVLAFQVPNQLR